MRRILPLSLCLTFLIQSLLGQIASPGTPRSTSVNMPRPASVMLPTIKRQQLITEDETDKELGLPPRFGEKLPLNLDLNNSGTWTNLSDGSRVWRLRVVAREAHSINFVFDTFILPPGGELFAYNDDHSYQIGAFTQKNMQPDYKFATAPVKGEAVTLELYEPAQYRGKSRLTVAYAVHAYRNLFDEADQVLRDFGDSGSCNNDVECKKAGWEDQISSVGIIIVSGNRTCSGAMINNTLNDGTPYFLTADHCMGGAAGGSVLSTWVFVFNYESPTCNGPDGNLSQSVSGGVVRAVFSDSDLALIELNSPPPAIYNVFYSGWDKRNIPADSSVAIHHPSNDVKKISFNNDVNVGSPGLSGVPNSHWQVTEWEDGTTEGGSSGSPLYNQDKRIVGQLHGGGAACSRPNDEDEYGKLSMSWDGGGTAATRLSDWLDPAQSGDLFIDGTYTFTLPDWDIALQRADGVENTQCDTVIEAVVFVRNLGVNAVNKITIDYQFDNGATQQYVWTGAAVATRQDVAITLPAETLNTGMHTFSATISAPNDSIDEVSTNNQVSTSFNAQMGNPIIIRLFADDFPGETVISIRDQVTYSLFDQKNDFRASTENIFETCLPDGCYSIVITDDSGDGLQGRFTDGYMLIEVEGVVVDSVGPNFGDSTFVDVCLPLPLEADFSVNSDACLQEQIRPVNNSTGADTYQWDAPNASPSSSSVRSPSFYYNVPGTYTISLIVTSSAGISDTTTQSVVVTDGSPLEVVVMTDAFPEESSYRIFDQNNNEVGNQLRFRQSQRTTTQNYCLPVGCYTFVMYDDAGDGMCCDFGNGGFELTDTRGNIFGSGGQFGSTDTVKFCLTGVGVEPIPPSSLISMYPNPAEDKVNLESSDLLKSIQVYDALGRLVLAKSVNSKREDLYTQDWPAGVYIVKISLETGNISKRLIVH